MSFFLLVTVGAYCVSTIVLGIYSRLRTVSLVLIAVPLLQFILEKTKLGAPLARGLATSGVWDLSRANLFGFLVRYLIGNGPPI